jgi:lipoprotein-anchoring transpeptidase ErfK/SrfK
LDLEETEPQPLGYIMKRLLIVLAAVLFSTSAFAEYHVVVSKSHQSMSVYQDGELIEQWPVSTARKGYYTPTGTFHPYFYHLMHYSKKYDNAPMPHSIFFSGGFAIHATPHTGNLGRPASHGCVRLHPDNASILYTMTKGEPTTITIKD